MTLTSQNVETVLDVVHVVFRGMLTEGGGGFLKINFLTRSSFILVKAIFDKVVFFLTFFEED